MIRNLTENQSPIGWRLEDTKGSQSISPLVLSSLQKFSLKSAFGYNNFSFVVVEKDMIPILGIQKSGCLADKPNISLPGNLAATQKFHFFHQINNINEIIKYITNDFNYINILIGNIDLRSGEEWTGANF